MIFFAFLLGLCTGSFLNRLIYRVPHGIGFVSGRSRCPSCGVKLPVRYPLVELAGGLLSVLVFVHYGFCLSAFSVFLTGALLLAIFMVDLDTMTIPNGFVIALIPFAALSAFLFPEVSPTARTIGFFCVSTPMLLMARLIPGSFGGGDIKLIAVCGFMLGWRLTLLAAFIAVMLGGAAALLLLITGRVKRDSHIPFGPALCVGCFACLLWGGDILMWYFALF